MINLDNDFLPFAINKIPLSDSKKAIILFLVILPRDLKNALVAQARPVSYESPTQTLQEVWSKRVVLGLDKLPTEIVNARVIGIT